MLLQTEEHLEGGMKKTAALSDERVAQRRQAQIKQMKQEKMLRSLKGELDWRMKTALEKAKST